MPGSQPDWFFASRYPIKTGFSWLAESCVFVATYDETLDGFAATRDWGSTPVIHP